MGKNPSKTKRPDFPTGKNRYFSLLLPSLLISCYFFQALWHAIDKSPTYDEPAHLTTSVLLSKTDHQDYEIGHPPLARFLFSFPLLFLNLSLPDQMPPPTVPPTAPLSDRSVGKLHTYSTLFIFANRISGEKLILSARMMNILLGCLLGYWIFLWSRRIYGERAALFCLSLFAFCPNLISHGSLVTTDMAGVSLAVGFLFALDRLLKKITTKNILFAGLLLGGALLSKYTNLFLVPLFVMVYLYVCFTKRRSSDFRHQIKIILKTVLMVLFLGWFTLSLGYKFDRVFSPHTLNAEDWRDLGYGKTFQTLYRYTPLPDPFLRGICYAIYHNKRGHAAFFLGEYSSQGWKSYFPVAFLVKTPSATLLVLLLWFIFLCVRRKWPEESEWLLILPVLFLFATSINARLNIGLRHVLLSYPLFYILLGRLASFPNLETNKGKVLFFLPLFILAIETLSISPHYLASFNRLSGGPEKGIDYLSDSNIDWGQDLENLAHYLKKEENPEVILSYFGTAPPQYYGIRYQSLPTVWSFPKSGHINSAKPAKEYLAISVTNLQGTYLGKHDLFAWLKEKEPLSKIGYSIYVYDITKDPESHRKIQEIYRMTGESKKFLRQANQVWGHEN